jgi:type I restriction enzyme S subunit
VIDLPDGVPVFADTHVTLLRFLPNFAESRYMAYLLGLPSSRDYIEEALSVGSTKQRELNVEALRAYKVVIGEIGEQRAIADFLDRECERIDDLMNACQGMRPALSEAALACFVDLTRDLPLVRLGHHYEVQLGKMLDEGKPNQSGLVPYLRNRNVGWDRFDLGDIKRMPLMSSEYPRYLVRPGDLLACEGRHVGKCAIWDGSVEPMYYQKALHRIRPRAGWSNRYLLWCLWLGNARGDFFADGTGSTIPHLPAEKLRAVRIPAAPRAQQDEIVREVDAIHRHSQAARDEIAAFEASLAEYRNALITEAVEGTLDVAQVSEAQIAESLAAVREGEPPEMLAR